VHGAVKYKSIDNIRIRCYIQLLVLLTQAPFEEGGNALRKYSVPQVRTYV